MNWLEKRKFKKNVLEFAKKVPSFPSNWLYMLDDECLWSSFFNCLFSRVDIAIKKSIDDINNSNIDDISNVLKAYVRSAIATNNYDLAFDLTKYYFKEWYRKER